MIGSYQDERAQEPTTVAPFAFATIGAVYADGVSLIFPGETAPSEKRYKVNTLGTYAAGQRVKVIKDSGTYIVEYPVGNPEDGNPEDGDTPLTVVLTGDATGSGMSNDNNTVSISTTVSDAEKAEKAGAVTNMSYSGNDNYNISFSAQTSSGPLRYRVGTGPWQTLANA